MVILTALIAPGGIQPRTQKLPSEPIGTTTTAMAQLMKVAMAIAAAIIVVAVTTMPGGTWAHRL